MIYPNELSIFFLAKQINLFLTFDELVCIWFN